MLKLVDKPALRSICGTRVAFVINSYCVNFEQSEARTMVSPSRVPEKLKGVTVPAIPTSGEKVGLAITRIFASLMCTHRPTTSSTFCTGRKQSVHVPGAAAVWRFTEVLPPEKV